MGTRRGARGCGHAAVGLALAAVACGARTPLDVTGEPGLDAGGPEAGHDASGDTGSARLDGGADVPRLPPDAGVDVEELPDAPRPADADICPNGGEPTAYLIDGNGGLYVYDPATRAARLLGTPDCGVGAGPWTLSVTRHGTAYVLYPNDWSLHSVDLTTLACEPTAFVPGQLGLDQSFAIAVSRTGTAEQMYFFGATSPSLRAPLLAVSDLTTFKLQDVGLGVPLPRGADLANAKYDAQADLFGHLFVLTNEGLLEKLDAASGRVLEAIDTGFNSTETSWAIMTYGTDVLMFEDTSVGRFDPATRRVVTLGEVSGVTDQIVGASAVPCVHQG